MLEEAHTVMESKKSHNLLSASKRATGLTQFEPAEPRTSARGGGQDNTPCRLGGDRILVCLWPVYRCWPSTC